MGSVRKTKPPFSRLVGAAPIRCGPMNRDQGWKPHLPGGGKSVYLFLEFTINHR